MSVTANWPPKTKSQMLELQSVHGSDIAISQALNRTIDEVRYARRRLEVPSLVNKTDAVKRKLTEAEIDAHYAKFPPNCYA